LTFYQFFQKQVEEEELTPEQSLVEIEKIEKYTHTKVDDLEFVDNEFTVEKYNEFLKIRFETIKGLFFKLNKIDT